MGAGKGHEFLVVDLTQWVFDGLEMRGSGWRQA